MLASRSPSKTKRFQFSLRGLLAVMLVVIVGLSVTPMRRWVEERRAEKRKADMIARLNELDVRVFFTFQRVSDALFFDERYDLTLSNAEKTARIDAVLFTTDENAPERVALLEQLPEIPEIFIVAGKFDGEYLSALDKSRHEAKIWHVSNWPYHDE